MSGLSGNTHRDTMKIRHHEHQQKALDQIRLLRDNFEKISKAEIASQLDEILKTLDEKISL